MARIPDATGHHRRRGMVSIGSLGVAAFLAMSICGPANADNPNSAVPIGDDGVARPGTTYTEDTLPAWKVRLVALHAEMRAGTMSQAEADEYNEIIDAKGFDPTGQIAEAVESPSGTSITPMTADFVSRYLTTTQSPNYGPTGAALPRPRASS